MPNYTRKILYERRFLYNTHLQLFEIYKMNLITNFYGLNIEDWERYAHTACFEINQVVKSQAERLFHDLTKTPDINAIITLINNGSQTLVFVLFTFLSKNPAPFAKNMSNVLSLIGAIGYWQFRSFTFIRQNEVALQKYITRTIMNALGIFLKIVYENQNTSKQLVSFIVQMKPSYFKLYILKSFVDAVEVIDYQMGYMKYRTMVYNFQDNIIPMICEVLMPYFYNIQEGVQINELSFLQQHLQVNDLETETSNSNNHISLTNQQEQQSDYVFMLLQKIVEFNYNITYSEYQSDQAIDTCLITFPDKIAAKIINQQFLGALFFIIEKVSEVKTGGRKLQYLQISLGCVAKMMQSRLTYLDLEVRENYIYHSLKGLTHLLLKCRQLGNQVLLEGILICNKKLYMNCELQSLKKTCIKHSGEEGLHLYKTYLKDLTQMIVLVFQNSLVQAENHLLLEAIQLGNKIIHSHGYKDQEIIDDEEIFFVDFIKAMIHTFINNLAQPTFIFKNNKISSITQSKTLINQLFQYFKKIASANFTFFFNCLLQKIDSFTTSSASPIIFSNILYFMSQIIDHNYLQRNIYLNKATDKEYCILGKVVLKAVNLVCEYMKSRTTFKTQEMFYIDTGVILFTEAIVLQFLSGFEFNAQLRIKQKLYFFMVYGDVYNELTQVQDQKSEDTIITFIKILSQFLQMSKYNDENEIIVHYVLNAIEKCIYKLKWHVKRQLYLKTRIFKCLLAFFESFFYNRNHVGDVRARVSKIVVTLTFDDVLDQYKFRIVKFLNIIKEQPLELLQYDLIGIFEGIETHTISKYFYNRLKKDIDLKQVVASLALRARDIHQQKAYKDFCRFIRSILNNKGFKINNAIVIYSLFQTLLPYLTDMLREINRTNSINMDIWEGSINQIMDVFKLGISSTHMNIFLLEKYTLSNSSSEVSIVKQFIIQIMKTIILLSNQIQTYPQMEQIMLGIYYEINKQLLDYVFGDGSGRLAQVYMLAHVKLIDISVSYLKTMMTGNKLVQERLTKTIDCLRYFMVYFNRKCKITHQHVNLANLKRIYQFSQSFANNQVVENKNEQLIYYLISFIMNSNKSNYSFFKTISRLIFELNKTFNVHIMNALSKIQLPEQKLKEAQQMMKMQQKESEQCFIEKIKIWIKQIDLFN